MDKVDAFVYFKAVVFS